MPAFLLAVLAAVVSPACAAAQCSTWVVPWDLAPASTLDSCFDQVNPFVFAFDGRGRPVLLDRAALARALSARARGAKVIPVVVNDVEDSSGAGASEKNRAILLQFLNTDELIDKHVHALMTSVWSDDFDGLEIDYERVPWPLYGRFARFIDRLADELHKRGKTLSVDLEAGALLSSGGPGARYWPQIARSADQLNLMMYYERGAFSSDVGPGSSLAWFARTAKTAASVVPAAKLTLVVSLSGTDWQTPYPRDITERRVRRLHYGEVEALMARVGARPLWSRRWSSPYFTYEHDGHAHEVFFEDERSVAAKFAAARAVGARVGLWYLGAIHPDLGQLGLCPR